jgi:hypothetical protein
MYLDEIITKWQKEDTKGIALSKNQQLLTLLFADEHLIILNTDDNLLKAAYKLRQILTEHGIIISVQKTKLITSTGTQPVRSKFVIDNINIEKVNFFIYLGKLISEK